MMTFKRYRTGILKAYEGERLGAATFALLAVRADFTAEQRAAMAMLAQLEECVAARLAPIVRRLDLPESASQDVAEAAAVRARSLSDWSKLVATMGDRLQPFVDQFAALSDGCDPQDRPALAFLYEHERALMAFAAAEIAGRTDAIAPVERLLQIGL